MCFHKIFLSIGHVYSDVATIKSSLLYKSLCFQEASVGYVYNLLGLQLNYY